MAEARIVLQPGINSIQTPTLNRAGWSSCNLIRWLGGLLQSIGGWQAFSTTPVYGSARSMHAFADLANNQYLAVGSNERVALYWGGVQYDITPISSSASLTDKFSTTVDSPTVNVNDVAHGAAAGDWIYLEIPLSVGGIVLFGYYPIDTVVDTDNYTIIAASNATATVSGGGDTPLFETTNGSSIVSVWLDGNTYQVGDPFSVQVSTSVGGLTLDGPYQVQTADFAVITIDAGSNASSDDTASENANAEIVDYLLSAGPARNEALVGWGGGGWGLGGWGESSSTGAINPARIWSLDNFGEILLLNPTGGGLYSWTPIPSAGNVAVDVGGSAPTANLGMFVAMPQAQVIVWGAEVGSSTDPLLLRWSDTGSYNDFTATVSNQAGSYRLSRGSKIVGGLQAAQTALIWTDVDLWAMVYQGSPFIYSISTISQNCGLIGQEAAAILAGNVYWMSTKGFFVLAGGNVSAIPCPVWDEIFADLDTANANLVVAGANTPFNEVFFFYPSASGGTSEIDKYVKVNVIEGLWDFGSLIRTAWIDQSLFGTPMGVDGTGLVQQHEIGYTDNGTPMTNVYAESGYADLTDGQEMAFVDQLIPDAKTYDSDARWTMTVYSTSYPGTSPVAHGPYNVTPTTKFITMRARARQIAIRVDFDGESFVRVGANRYRIAPAGRSVGAAA